MIPAAGDCMRECLRGDRKSGGAAYALHPGIGRADCESPLPRESLQLSRDVRFVSLSFS